MFLRNIFEALARTGEGKAAVVGWGRGMGHKGHMMLASSVITHANQLSADPYFVVSRTVGKDDPITPDEKLAIYKKVFPEQGHIFQTATDEIPDLTRVLSDLNRQGYTSATIVLGADQVKAFQYLKNYNGKPDKAGNVPYTFDKLDVISRQETSDPSAGEEGPRATPMRAVLMDPTKSEQEQFQVWRDAMNPQVSDEEVRDLMMKAKERMTALVKPKKGVAEVSLGNVLPWPVVANKINSAMKAMGWKGQRKGDDSYLFSTKGAEDESQYYMVMIDNEGNGMFTYALGTWEEGRPDIGEQDTLPTTEASVSEVLMAIRDGYGLNEQGVAEGESDAIDTVAKRLTDPKDGMTAKLRAAGDKRREDKLKGRNISRRDTTSKDEWGDLKELSNDALGRYKKAASADASAADKAGNYKRADKRFSGIVKATKKQFANDVNGQTEEKQRLDPSCWKGYRKAGTKMKGDTRVNNCVKVSEGVENIMDNLINKIIVNEAIQNNRK